MYTTYQHNGKATPAHQSYGIRVYDWLYPIVDISWTSYGVRTLDMTNKKENHAHNTTPYYKGTLSKPIQKNCKLCNCLAKPYSLIHFDRTASDIGDQVEYATSVSCVVGWTASDTADCVDWTPTKWRLTIPLRERWGVSTIALTERQAMSAI